MGWKATLYLIGGYFLLSLFLLPMQYPYIKAIKERKKELEEKGISQEEMYEKMSFEEQQLTFALQGSILFLGSNLLATVLYNWKEKKKIKSN